METKEKCRARKKAWRKAHPEEQRAYQKRWYKAHPEKDRARKKAWHEAYPGREHAQKIKHKYGLSQDKFNTLLYSQGGACAVCRRPFTGTPVVDHNHETGKVRGLLCHPCNRGLGDFKDDPVRMRLAAEYLEKEDI